jgi:hypothetical protein
VAESADERTARLTELAQRVYLTDEHHLPGVYTLGRGAAVLTDGQHNMMMFEGPRALDAIEAALRVLAGEPPSWATELAEEWLAEAKRIPKYEKYDQSIPYVRAAVLTGERCYRSLALQLLEAAKGGAQ